MRHIFISPPEIISPRWREAFPLAQIMSPDHLLLDEISETTIWYLVSGSAERNLIRQWSSEGARVIGLTQSENYAEAKEIVELGASGYLHYLAVVPVLMQVAKVVELGGLWLGADLLRQLVFATSTALNTSHDAECLQILSVRELAVAKAVAAGKTNKEVAKELEITERTVKAHLSAVFEKLKVRDRLQLVLVMSGK